MKIIWISWEHHRRNVEISLHMGCKLFEIEVRKNRLLRYILSSIKTIQKLIETKPDVVIVQNPSIVLSCLIIFLQLIFKYQSVIDSHYSGIFPFEGRYAVLNFISKYIQKNADFTIVTNNVNSDSVLRNGGRPIVLPDRIPQLQGFPGHIKMQGEFNITYICSYHEDEPYTEVIRASKMLNDSINIHFTGDHTNRLYLDDIDNNNLRFHGYLPEDEYWKLLSSSDCIMDLTLREGCLVCGAYEGIALEKPLILSNTKTNNEYFTGGCIFTQPDAQSIASAINEMIENEIRFKKEIIDVKETLMNDWCHRFDYFMDTLINRVHKESNLRYKLT